MSCTLRVWPRIVQAGPRKPGILIQRLPKTPRILQRGVYPTLQAAINHLPRTLCSSSSNPHPPPTSLPPEASLVSADKTQKVVRFEVEEEEQEEDVDIHLPDPPTTCCMSGCANCVWIEYAKELAVLYKDGGQAAEKVMKAIEDPSLKIFLSLELRDISKQDH